MAVKNANAKGWELKTSRDGLKWSKYPRGESPPPVFGDFSTTFSSLIENPINQGGIWNRGLQEGLKWTDPKTTTNGAVASTVPTPNRYDDDIAFLKTSYRTFTPNQYAQAVMYKASGYIGGGGSHECELFLRATMSANVAQGYEISIGINAGGVYAFIVRWEGPEGTYVALVDPGSGIGSYLNVPSFPADGDLYRAEITGTVINFFQNGVQLLQYDTALDGTKFSSGQPGFGFWPVDGATPDNMGWKSFAAGNL